MPELTLVVPCFNEEPNVEPFFQTVKNTFEGKVSDYEIVFVDDGSRDKTLEKLKKVRGENPNEKIKVVSFSRNFGKESAIFAGLKNAEGEKICIIDADLQQSPSLVLTMRDMLNNNPELDCVAAYQEQRRESAFLKLFKPLFYKIANNISDISFTQGASDFRTFRRSVAEAMISLGEYHRFTKGIFSWVGFKTEYIPYTADVRAAGESKWNFKKLLNYGLGGILSFTTAPLRFSTYLGFIAAIGALIYCIIVVIEKLCFSIAVSGYATTVILILLLGGMQLFCLGIIGEYLSRLYIQAKNRPIYIVKELLGYNENTEKSENS